MDGLRAVMRSLGHEPTDEEPRHILLDADASGSVTFDKFAALVASLHGDTESRLALAFEVFDANRDGVVMQNEVRDMLAPFGLSETELKQIFREADRDGDGSLDRDDFRRLMPEEHEQADRYRDSHALFANTLRRQASAPAAEQAAPPAPRPNVARPAKPAVDLHEARGTLRLQMQIGLFRLLQGAAYRSFRENYCANYETHLRAKKLPYTIPHFVAFVGRTIARYKALGVVEAACFPVLDALTASIEAGNARFRERIARWPTLPKTPEMLQPGAAMPAEESQAAALRQKFAAGVELALTLRKKHLGLADLVEDLLATHELNRLRRLELRGDGGVGRGGGCRSRA